MARFFAILLLLLGSAALSAHPFDDRADMVAEVMLLHDDQGRESMRLSIQYRYESFFASYNEAMLEIDNDRSETIDREEINIRFRELAKDLQDTVYIAVRGVPATIEPRYSDFYFGNLDDPDATPDQPGGMPCLKLRIGYYFLFDVMPSARVPIGRHPVEFYLANDRIVVQNSREQLRAWDDRGEHRRAVITVDYDRTPDRYARLRFIWEVNKGDVQASISPIIPSARPDPIQPARIVQPEQPSGKEQLLETDRERFNPDTTENKIVEAMEQLRDGRADPAVWLAVLSLMFFWGASHALMPGHGKTLVAGYLIGTRGKRSDALFLGLVVTAAHTSGVYLLLGAAWMVRTMWPDLLDNPEKQIAEWIAVAVGATILLMGIGLVLKRTSGGHHEHDIFGRHVHPEDDHHHHHDHPHTHSHDEKHPEDSDIHQHVHSHSHSHSHGHSHDHGDGHHHHHHKELDPGKMTRWEILRLGILGGVIPCPSAFVIGLLAFQWKMEIAGLIAVLVFSVGLAGVLAVIGLMLVQTKEYLHNRSRKKGRFAQLAEQKLPVLGALAITLVGAVILLFALVRLSVIDPATFTI